jgi:hypothetical protein
MKDLSLLLIVPSFNIFKIILSNLEEKGEINELQEIAADLPIVWGTYHLSLEITEEF